MDCILAIVIARSDCLALCVATPWQSNPTMGKVELKAKCPVWDKEAKSGHFDLFNVFQVFDSQFIVNELYF